jgi:hypothetical protein
MAVFPSGANFQILSATKNVDVVFELNGQKVNSGKNLPASYYYRPQEIARGVNAFDVVKITASYGDTTIVIDISDGESGTNILSGDVGIAQRIVVDQMQLVSDSIINTVGLSGGLAGQYGKVAIQNPLSSGVVRYVTNVNINCNQYAQYGVAKIPYFDFVAGVGWALQAADTYAYTGSTSGMPVAGSESVRFGRLEIGTNHSFDFKKGIALLEGESLIVEGSTPSTWLAVSFDAEDRAIL